MSLYMWFWRVGSSPRRRDFRLPRKNLEARAQCRPCTNLPKSPVFEKRPAFWNVIYGVCLEYFHSLRLKVPDLKVWFYCARLGPPVWSPSRCLPANACSFAPILLQCLLSQVTVASHPDTVGTGDGDEVVSRHPGTFSEWEGHTQPANRRGAFLAGILSLHSTSIASQRPGLDDDGSGFVWLQIVAVVRAQVSL